MLGNILGGLVGGVLNLFGQNRANQTNRDISSAQMAFQADSQADAMHFGREMTGRQEDFQRETLSNAMAYNSHMADTSYRRGMADMRAAGLNPILAYGQGGATSPTVGAASGSHASVGALPGASARMENELGPAVGSAVQAARAVTELEQLAANVQQTKATTNLVGEQQHQVRSNTALQTAQAISEGVRPELIRAQTRTEQGRPALLGAQTALAGATARTEAERPELVRSQAGATIHHGNLSRTQEHQLRTYGSGVVGSTVGGVSQTLNSILQSLRDALR